jgi:SHS2 domain-containing protein
METTTLSGFEEIDHMADWAVRIWAPDLNELFLQSAKALYSLMGVRPLPGAEVEEPLYLESVDMEALLVSFLNELLYRYEQKGLICEVIDVRVEPYYLLARLIGRRCSPALKEIKAVTFHRLKIVQNGKVCETQIVFDV